MRYIEYHSLGGVSGDMVLGSLVALGVPVETIEKQVCVLPLESFSIRAQAGEDSGLHGVRLFVDMPGEHEHHESAHHRSFRDIQELISNSELAPRVKDLSLRVFQRLAEAEGTVHGCSAADVHFHEVGAVDSIVDIVGAAVAFNELDIAGVHIDSFPVGSGTVVCQHGTYPVPAPATMILLRNQSIERTGEVRELVTPTGAALLTTLQLGELPRKYRLITEGYALGHCALEQRPNVLRGALCEAAVG